MAVERFLTYADPELRRGMSRLAPGAYRIEYSDSTHMRAGEWRALLDVRLETGRLGPGEDPVSPYYTVRAALDAATQHKKQASDESAAQERRILRDQLGQSLVRCGLLKPEFGDEEALDLLRLSRAQAVILLPDTNSLFNGTVHWLARALGRTQLWIQPVSVSLAQVQNRDAGLKPMVGKARPGNLPQALRSRAFVNASLGLLERLGDRYQVLEVAPELLRYVRTSMKEGGDPDQGDVLEDRLLLEAVHAAWRSTRSRAERRVVTSDVLFARILHAEGLTPLFLQPLLIPEEPVPCMRFEPLAHRFEGAPLPFLMWDLAHAFGKVRLRRTDEENATVELNVYWARKGFQDWKGERLQVNLPAADSTASSSTSGAPARPVLPTATLHNVLCLGGSLLHGPGTLDDLVRRPPFSAKGQGATRDAESAAEVLLGARLAIRLESQLRPTDALSELDKALQLGELDSVSGLLAKFRPYSLLLDEMKARRAIDLKSLDRFLRDFSGSVAAFERLSRFPVLLGQGWMPLEGNILRDGSQRPSPEGFAEAFRAVFARVEKQGLASVLELIPALCMECSMSPWAVRRMMTDAMEVVRLLPEFAFEPAAAVRRPVLGDSVVAGSLRNPKFMRLPATFVMGGSPVFTVARRAQP